LLSNHSHYHIQKRLRHNSGSGNIPQSGAAVLIGTALSRTGCMSWNFDGISRFHRELDYFTHAGEGEDEGECGVPAPALDLGRNAGSLVAGAVLRTFAGQPSQEEVRILDIDQPLRDLHLKPEWTAHSDSDDNISDGEETKAAVYASRRNGAPAFRKQPAQEQEQEHEVEQEQEQEQEQEHEVEALLSRRRNEHRCPGYRRESIVFEVQSKGFKETTWEPASALSEEVKAMWEFNPKGNRRRSTAPALERQRKRVERLAAGGGGGGGGGGGSGGSGSGGGGGGN
jgi:hypothetical protein